MARNERDTEFLGTMLRSAVAHQRGVQALSSVAHERAVGRPVIKAALGKPRLELTRDAILAPALMFRRRHPSLVAAPAAAWPGRYHQTTSRAGHLTSR